MKAFKTLLWIGILSISFVNVQSQTFEEFKKQREKELKAQKEDYKKFIEKHDKDFSRYLKKRWEEFQVFKGVEASETPKPVKAPAYTPNKESSTRFFGPFKSNTKFVLPSLKDMDDGFFANLFSENKSISDPETEPENEVNNNSNEVIVEEVEESEEVEDVTDHSIEEATIEEDFSGISFDYFGADIKISTSVNIQEPFDNNLSERNFSNYWSDMAAVDYENTIRDLAKNADELQLNDWAYYMLVEKYAYNIHSNDKVSAQLLSWFLLIKSGYKVKMAYKENRISLMIPSDHQIYGKSYIRIGDVNYYIINPFNSSVYTYKNDFEGATKSFKLNFNKELTLPINKKYRNLDFNYGQQDYSVSIVYNQNLVDFYSAYPSVDLNINFNAPVSNLTARSLQSEFNRILENRTTAEKANLLLTFIHKALPYKTDGEQFGKEKYFYVEDIFSFSHSDCEDRSVLYSYLIDNLVGLNTIGLNAPGHVFTAVEFNGVEGDYISFDGKNFTICDPTYIGAKIGKTMPNMNKDLKIIPKE